MHARATMRHDAGVRSAEWARAARRYLLPDLPGSWGIQGALIYRLPMEWLLCSVVMQTRPGLRTFGLRADVQLLAVPRSYLTADLSASQAWDGPRGQWELPAELDDSTQVMRTVRDSILEETPEYFDRFGDLDGYASGVRGLLGLNPLNCNYHEEHCYVRLLQGDAPSALAAAGDAIRTAEADGRDWALTLRDRVATVSAAAREDPARAVDLLREQAAWTRSELHLPPVA